MSRKKKKVAASDLPEDSFTFTDGSSYGLDTFLFDMEENEGVLQSARLPQTKGLSRIPGVSSTEESSFSQVPYGPSVYTHGPGGRQAHEEEEDWDVGLGEDRLDGIRVLLGADAEDTDYVRLPALDWLELETPEEKQDPDRLPRNPVDQSIKELEEAWGVHRRTDGVVVYDDRQARASESPFRLEGNNLDLDHARYAASLEQEPETRYHYSVPDLKVIIAEASRRSASGEPLRSILDDVSSLLKAELPRVRDSLKAIVSDHGLVGNIFIRASAYPGCHNGKWAKHVKKNCKTARYIVKAYGCKDCIHNQKGTCGVFQGRLVSQVPWQEALDAYRPDFERDGIRVATGDPRQALKKAFQSKAPVVSLETYFPEENPTGVIRQEELLRTAQEKKAFQEVERLRFQGKDAKKRKLAAYVGKLKSAGLLSEKQAKAVLKKAKDMEEVRTLVAAFVHRASHKEGVHDTGERAFGGNRKSHVRVLSERDKLLRGIAKKAGVKPPVVEELLRVVATDMNEGYAGRSLDEMLRLHSSTSLRKAAKDVIRKLRAKHEGLAGHLYVDAATYGGKEGIKGCEKGGLRHRANDVPYVLEMSKCEGCVFRNAHDNCQKYNKELVSLSDFDPRELEEARQQNIRLANSSEIERTASIFAPVENPVDEWGLHNDNLDNFSFFKESREEDELDDLDFADFGLGDGFDL